MPPKGVSRAKPFKPPHPSAVHKSTASASSSRRVSAKATTSKAKGKGQEKEAEQQSSENVIDDDDDPFASSGPEVEAEPDVEPAPEPEIEKPDVPEISIQPELLTKILHEFFTADGGMRISKDASKAVGKYMHTFVQEALHRAVAENRKEAAMNGRSAGNDTFLEVSLSCGSRMALRSQKLIDFKCFKVEDLEKLAPQMLLDF